MIDAQLLLLGTATLTNLLFAGAAGGLVCTSCLPANVEGHPRLNGVLPLSIILLGATHLGYLWLQTALMGDTSLIMAGSLVWMVLSTSHYGHVWLMGSAGLLLALGALLWPRSQRQSPQRMVIALGLVLYAAGRAATSHAAGSGDITLMVGLHWLHLCATGIWAGIVLISSFIVLSPKNRRIPDNVIRIFCQRVSQVATWTFVMALVTGIYNIRHIVVQSEISSIFYASYYGHLFGIKTLLVLAVVVLAGINREWGLPNLLRLTTAIDPSFRRFAILLRAEAWLMLLVLLIATWFAHSSPVG